MHQLDRFLLNGQIQLTFQFFPLRPNNIFTIRGSLQLGAIREAAVHPLYWTCMLWVSLQVVLVTPNSPLEVNGYHLLESDRLEANPCKISSP